MAELRYLDACTFIGYAANEAGRGHAMATLLDEAEDGSVEVYTSTLSIAEVAFAIEEGGVIPEEVEERIDGLWIPPSPVQLIDAHQGVMYRARQVMRDQKRQGRNLKAADAIHLATALLYEIPTFFTYDDKLLALDGHEGLSISEPAPLEQKLDLH